jgi:hypothetical protein
MKRSETKPSRLHVTSEGTMNRLSSRSRKSLKRRASKKRRTMLKSVDADHQSDV